jgi:hypothetical protein
MQAQKEVIDRAGHRRRPALSRLQPFGDQSIKDSEIRRKESTDGLETFPVLILAVVEGVLAKGNIISIDQV